MTILSKAYPMDLGTGSIEQVRQSAPKIDMELGAIYGHLNNIRTRYRSATAPINPETGQVWEDTVNAKVMKWNGSAWVEDIAKSLNLTNRNTVLQGQVSSVGALELILGSTSALTADLVSSAIETIIAISAGHDATTGNSDYIVSFSATQTAFWTSLPANNTSYLFVDYSSGTVTGTYSVIAPVYQSFAPAHAAGKNWYDTNKEQWYSSNGSAWTAVYRCYVGSVVTDGTKVTATTIEPYNVIRSSVPMTYLDTDGTLAANSDSKIATQKAVKTYVDAKPSGGGAIGTGNYIAEPFSVVPGTGLEVLVGPNRCVIDETAVESTAQTAVALTAKAAQLVFKKKDGTYDKLLASFASIDASNVLRWVSDSWDGSSAIATTVGTNNLTKNGTVSLVDGIMGNAGQGNGSSGYLKAANTTNIPAYANAGTHHHAFRFISNGAAQCFYDDGVIEIACTSANNLRIGGVDTGYTLTTLTDYNVSISRAGGSTTGIVYVEGVAVYSGAVIVNTSVVAPNILSNNAPGEYSSSIWYGTMIDSVERTPAQIATLAQKLLIPCSYQQPLTSVIPTMTANNLPSGYVATASTESAGYEAYKAFDNSDATYFGTASSYTSGHLQLQMPAAKQIVAMAIKSTTVAGTPYDFYLSGSNDGTNWTTLLTVAGYTPATNTQQTQWVGNNSNQYTYYRLTFTSNNGGSTTYFAKLDLFELSNITTDIRDALANPTESKIVTYCETSATGIKKLIAPNDPKGATPDWAYGMRIGPMGALNRRKFLGWQNVNNTPATKTWDSPFGSDKLINTFVFARDTTGFMQTMVNVNGSNCTPARTSAKPIALYNQLVAGYAYINGSIEYNGYLGAYSEVID